MTIAVASLGCTRKMRDIHSWHTLAQLQGDYRLYINWEFQSEPQPQDVDKLKDWDNLKTISQEHKLLETTYKSLCELNPSLQVNIDWWEWHSSFGADWRKRPKFDQDQARLASIVTARSMCIEFAMQTECTHLLFIDADIVPPLDIIPKLLEVGHDSVGGLVHGRGAHSDCQYVFGEKRRYHQNGYELIEAEHGNIGYTLLSRKLIENIRFRYGVSKYPDGREHMISDDPAFHLDAFIKFGHWMTIRTDVIGRHLGQLKTEETAQF